MRDEMDDLRLFLRIVEAGSLAGAARSTGMDPSIVSRHLTRLERRLQVKLVERVRMGARLTDEGQRFHERLAPLLADLDGLEASVRAGTGRPQGLLRVAAPLDFGAAHVGPWLAELVDDAPDLRGDLVLSDDFVDARAQGIDVTIRIGALPDSEMVARRLGTMRLCIVGPADTEARFGPIVRPDDLLRVPFVHFSKFRVGPRIDLAHDAHATAAVEYPHRIQTNNLGAAARMVEMGAGLHVGPLWFFAPLIGTGRLARILPDWRPPDYPVSAVYAPTRHLTGKIRAFVDLALKRTALIEGIL
jgi:DNA-binding transcriptional LysR family regulator